MKGIAIAINPMQAIPIVSDNILSPVGGKAVAV